MRSTAAKAVAVLALSVALLIIGGIGLSSSGTSAGTAPIRPSGSGSLPMADPSSLEATTVALRARTAEAPEDARAFAALGAVLVQQARVSGDYSPYPEAEAALRRSLVLQPDNNTDALIGMGTLALARHEFADALDFGQLARDTNPQSAAAHGVIGDALIELGRYDEAFVALQQMVDLRPDVASYTRIAYARELQGDVAGAIKAMRDALPMAASPADAAWVSFQIGALERHRGGIEAAEEWYHRALALAPGSVPARAGLADVAWARGEVAVAIARYRRVVEDLPMPEYLTALGDLYASQERDADAAAQYAVVVVERKLAAANGVAPGPEVVLFEANHGDHSAALDAAEAEWRVRKSVHVADAYAWALYRAGRYDEAADASERALHLGTRKASFLFHAGMIELARGHEAVAADFLEEALATDPHFSILDAPRAARELARLQQAR